MTVFNDPTEALAAFQISPMSFDVVVTDMTMPKLTGDLLAAAIKRIRSDVLNLQTGHFTEPTSTIAFCLQVSAPGALMSHWDEFLHSTPT